MPALFAFLHHAAAFVLFASLFAELILLRQSMNAQLARSLVRVDIIYGVSAGLVVVFGLVRVYFTEKGADYYLHSGTFIAKIVLFVLIGILSSGPTRTFIGWRRELAAGNSPALDDAHRSSLRRIIHLELTLLVLLILCAVLMARGIGYFG